MHYCSFIQGKANVKAKKHQAIKLIQVVSDSLFPGVLQALQLTHSKSKDENFGPKFKFLMKIWVFWCTNISRTISFSKIQYFFQISMNAKKPLTFKKTTSIKVVFNKPSIKQGGTSEWRVHSTLILENLKPVEISKNHFNFTFLWWIRVCHKVPELYFQSKFSM